MSTILIVLVIIFLLGGGGFGWYSSRPGYAGISPTYGIGGLFVTVLVVWLFLRLLGVA